jgi:hypothetical protein
MIVFLYGVNTEKIRFASKMERDESIALGTRDFENLVNIVDGPQGPHPITNLQPGPGPGLGPATGSNKEGGEVRPHMRASDSDNRGFSLKHRRLNPGFQVS